MTRLHSNYVRLTHGSRDTSSNVATRIRKKSIGAAAHTRNVYILTSIITWAQFSTSLSPARRDAERSPSIFHHRISKTARENVQFNCQKAAKLWVCLKFAHFPIVEILQNRKEEREEKLLMGNFSHKFDELLIDFESISLSFGLSHRVRVASVVWCGRQH